jgi:site-specific recombinase XerC
MWNLVGFQTRLKIGEQKRIFQMIPGLEEAEFLRWGSIHRNTYLNFPARLTAHGSLRDRPSCSSPGSSPGWRVHGVHRGGDPRGGEPGPDRARGGAGGPAADHHAGRADALPARGGPAHFQPMNSNFGLVDPLETPVRDKQRKRELLAERGQADFAAWMSHGHACGGDRVRRGGGRGMTGIPAARTIAPPELEEFLRHVEHERQLSRARCAPTADDLAEFEAFLTRYYGSDEWSWSGVDRLAIRSFMGDCLTRRGSRASARSRGSSPPCGALPLPARGGAGGGEPRPSVRTPKRERTLPGFLTREQMERSSALAEGRALEGGFLGVRNLAIVELFYSTGLRVSELQQLEPSDLDLVSERVRVRARGARSGSSPSGGPRSRRCAATSRGATRCWPRGEPRRPPRRLPRPDGRRLSVRQVQKIVCGFLDQIGRTRASPPTRSATASPRTWWTPAPT